MPTGTLLSALQVPGTPCWAKLGRLFVGSAFGKNSAIFEDGGDALNTFSGTFHAHNAGAAANPLAARLRDFFRKHKHEIDIRTLGHALIDEEEDAVAADVACARLHLDGVALAVGKLDLERCLNGNALRLALFRKGFRHVRATLARQRANVNDELVCQQAADVHLAAPPGRFDTRHQAVR